MVEEVNSTPKPHQQDDKEKKRKKNHIFPTKNEPKLKRREGFLLLLE